MIRILAFAALVAGALAGVEDGGAAYSVPTYPAATAQVSSYAAAPPMSSMSKSMSTSWQVWPTTTAMATPTAVAMNSTVTAMPSLMTISSMAKPTSSGWPMAPMATHTVIVGGTSLVYTPPSLSGVKDKDTIIFLFLEANHTITQSSFAMPCMEAGSGFKSGFMPSNGILIPFIIVEFIDSTHTGAPLWFYCGQGDHCQAGMRFSINAANDQDMAWRALDTLNSTKASSVMMSTSSIKSSSMMMSMSSSKTMSTSMAMASASVVPGMGTMNNGQCMCDCLCGVNAFPAGAGIGMMGGLPGMIPAASGPSMTGAMSSSPAYTSGAGGWK